MNVAALPLAQPARLTSSCRTVAMLIEYSVSSVTLVCVHVPLTAVVCGRAVLLRSPDVADKAPLLSAACPPTMKATTFAPALYVPAAVKMSDALLMVAALAMVTPVKRAPTAHSSLLACEPGDRLASLISVTPVLVNTRPASLAMSFWRLSPADAPICRLSVVTCARSVFLLQHQAQSQSPNRPAPLVRASPLCHSAPALLFQPQNLSAQRSHPW